MACNGERQRLVRPGPDSDMTVTHSAQGGVGACGCRRIVRWSLASTMATQRHLRIADDRTPTVRINYGAEIAPIIPALPRRYFGSALLRRYWRSFVHRPKGTILAIRKPLGIQDTARKPRSASCTIRRSLAARGEPVPVGTLIVLIGAPHPEPGRPAHKSGALGRHHRWQAGIRHADKEICEDISPHLPPMKERPSAGQQWHGHGGASPRPSLVNAEGPARLRCPEPTARRGQPCQVNLITMLPRSCRAKSSVERHEPHALRDATVGPVAPGVEGGPVSHDSGTTQTDGRA